MWEKTRWRVPHFNGQSIKIDCYVASLLTWCTLLQHALLHFAAILCNLHEKEFVSQRSSDVHGTFAWLKSRPSL
jgi:hypothetical protein